MSEHTYDFTLTGTVTAESESEARRLILRRLISGSHPTDEPVLFDHLYDDELGLELTLVGEVFDASSIEADPMNAQRRGL